MFLQAVEPGVGVCSPTYVGSHSSIAAAHRAAVGALPGPGQRGHKSPNVRAYIFHEDHIYPLIRALHLDIVMSTEKDPGADLRSMSGWSSIKGFDWVEEVVFDPGIGRVRVNR